MDEPGLEMLVDTAGHREPSGRVLALLDRWRQLSSARHELQERQVTLEEEERSIRQELLSLLSCDRALEVGRGAALDQGRVDDRVRLRIWLLGAFRVEYEGRPVELCGGDRVSAIVRFLAAQGPRGLHKERLAAQFWPDADPRAARRNLHQGIYTIRRRLVRYGAEGELNYANDRYAFGGDDRWCDLDEVIEWSERARSTSRDGDTRAAVDAAARVVELYAGDLLADHPYDEWAEPLRHRIRCRHREAADILLEHHRALDDLGSVIELSERLLALDPTDEGACRFLIHAHIGRGHHHLASLAYEKLRVAMGTELGMEPSKETISMIGS